MSESWDDPYIGAVTGVRCKSEHPTIAACRCMRLAGHDGTHRYTSSDDGRSVTWGEAHGEWVAGPETTR